MVVEKILSITRCLLQYAACRNHLVVDDVSECPRTAAPRIDHGDREFGTTTPTPSTASTASTPTSAPRPVATVRRYWRGNAGACRLSKQTDDVVEAPVQRSLLAIDAVHLAGEHTLLLFRLEVGDDLAPEQANFLEQEWWDVGALWVGERWHEHARPSRPHLVLVEVNLRGPVVKHEFKHITGLDEIAHEEVAIVIVASIVVVQVRHRCFFEVSAEVLVVPVGNHDLAVGIRRRHQNHDYVVKNFIH